MENAISQRIKELRLENGMTQSDLARLCSVKQSCVSKWERGATLPTADMLIILAQIFDASADYILGLKDF